MTRRGTIPALGGRAFGFPYIFALLLVVSTLLSGCAGQAPEVIPPLSPALVAARFGMGTVRAFAWTADGSVLVAGGDTGRLYVIDAATGRFRTAIPCGAPIRSLCVVGQTIVAGTADGTVGRWALDDGGIAKPLATLTVGSPVTSLAVDANGTLAAIASESGQVTLWDQKSARAQAVRTDLPTGSARGVAFSTNGNVVYCGGDDGIVRALAVPSLSDVKSGPPQNTRILSLAALANGKIAVGGEDGGVRLVDGASLSVTTRYGDLHGPVLTVATHGPFVAAGSTEQRLAVWKTDADGPAHMVGDPAQPDASGTVLACGFSPDGKAVAAAGDNRLVTLRSLDAGAKADPVLYGKPQSIHALALAPDDRTIATVGSGPDVLLWDTQAHALQRVLPVKGVLGSAQAVAWSSKGLLAIGAEDGSVCLIDPVSGIVTRGETPSAGTSPPRQVNDVAFAPDGSVLASAGWDRKIHVWDVADGALKHRAVLSGHANGISGICFSSDGATLGSSSWDHTARTWDVAAGAQKTSVSGMTGPMFAVAIGPGPSLAVGGWHGQTWLWSLEGDTVGTLTRQSQQTDVVSRIAFSHNGKWVASGSADRTVWLFELQEGMRPLIPHIGDFRAGVRGLAWTKDDSRVVVATFDGNLFLLPSQIPGVPDVPAPTLTPTGAASAAPAPATPASAAPGSAAPASASPAASSSP